ncbi:hypothetical protein B296_00039975 [Ensete ventricosum]|uniref:Exostosin GT47 domain-containing protein n=1 Tax=Ensete ventricosum TaxID=4639 RepID=A0A426YFE0_ENSVE|nr:hypothetical protein B296_00039975 [Ensete ventricosum]
MPFFFCLTFLVLLVIPYLFFWVDSGKQVVSHVLPKEKIVSVIENLNTPSTNHEGESTLFKESTFLHQHAPADEESTQCNPGNALLKVFMYDLPPEFHFGILGWNGDGKSVWPNIRAEVPHYPGGLNLQHSIDYWLTLDLLSSRFSDRSAPCSAVRVEDSREADVVFVPFFSSLSYNRHSKVNPPETVSTNELLQKKLVEFLTSQREWKRSGGRDHIIMAHHPNSMLDARMKLSPCMFILSDFGRYFPHVANVEKDIIAPYKHLIKTFVNDSFGFDNRSILLSRTLYECRNCEKRVHFAFGSLRENGTDEASRGMHSSKFCLSIAGDTPSSNRLFDAIASHCVPVIISDDIELPYEDVLDYSKFCIFVRTFDAIKKGFLMTLVRSVSREDWTQMWQRLKEVEGYFEFQYPSKKDDAVQMVWQAVARKVPAIQLKVHRSSRFSRFDVYR